MFPVFDILSVFRFAVPYCCFFRTAGMSYLQPRRAEQVFWGQAFFRPPFLGPSGFPASCAPLNRAAGSSNVLPVANADSIRFERPTINNGPPVCSLRLRLPV